MIYHIYPHAWERGVELILEKIEPSKVEVVIGGM
jgi:hypothetical protein